MLKQIKLQMQSLANVQKAKILQRFFKTGQGEYGEGDIFIGLTVPQLRQITKQYWQNITLHEIQNLLHSKIHEERTLALFMLIEKFNKVKDINQREIIRNVSNFY